MYSSPIKITGWNPDEDIVELINELAEKILQAINNELNLTIDKNKLIRALITDRASYYEGYADGYTAACNIFMPSRDFILFKDSSNSIEKEED